MNIDVARAQLVLEGRWRYRQESWPNAHDSGRVTIFIKNMHMRTASTLGLNVTWPARASRAEHHTQETHNKGVPSDKTSLPVPNYTHVVVKKTQARAQAGGVRIDVHGAKDWIYEFVAKVFAEKLQSKVRAAMGDGGGDNNPGTWHDKMT